MAIKQPILPIEISMLSLKIFIADGDLLARMTLERSVVTWGHIFISAADGEIAQEILKEQSFDVCILAWETARFSGLDLCKWIRSGGRNENAHIIIMTSKGRPDDMQAGYEAGANIYLTKPADLKYLRRQLARLAHNISEGEAGKRSEQKPDALKYFGEDFLFSRR